MDGAFLNWLHPREALSEEEAAEEEGKCRREEEQVTPGASEIMIVIKLDKISI